VGLEVSAIAFGYVSHEKHMTPKLKAEFETAQKDREAMSRQLKVMQTAESEEYPIVQIIEKLAVIKPEDIKLSRAEVSDGGAVVVEGFCNSPSVISNYAELINAEKNMLQNGQLDRISSSGDGALKTFVIKASAIR
jgi:hypothetical protein